MDQPVSHLKAKQDEIKMKKQQRRDDRISIVKLPFYQSLKKPEGENFFIDVEMVMAFTSKLKYDLYHQEKKRIQSIRPKLSNEQIKLHLKNFTNTKKCFKQVAGNVCVINQRGDVVFWAYIDVEYVHNYVTWVSGLSKDKLDKMLKFEIVCTNL